MAWPLVGNDKEKNDFKSFAVTDVGLSDKEAIALTVSTVNLFPLLRDDILNIDVSILM